MATKFYLHAASSTVTGTLPTTEQSTLTADDDFEGSKTTNRSMDTSKGTSQANLTNASTASASLVTYYVSRWVSLPIANTSVSANTWTLEFGAKESNAAANFPCTSTAQPIWINCYVWKPSNGTKYGTILDGNSASDFEEAGTTQSVISGTFTGSAVSSLTAGDAVIIYEMWFKITQGTAVSRTQDIYYDGTTENSTTTEAAFLSTPQTLNFAYTQALATQTTTVGESLARVVGAQRATANETTTVGETLARSYGAVRPLGAPTVLFDGSNDRINCGNHATLWSQSLTKFSCSLWFYNTQGFDGVNFRNLFTHGGASAQAFRAYFGNTNGKLRWALRNAAGVEQAGETNSEPSLNQWHNVVCTYDNSLGSNQILIYLDKVLQTSKGTLTEAINFNGDLSLSDASTDFAGNLKDFRFWTTTPLTQTDVDNVYNNSPSAPTPNYWLKMDEGIGTPVDSIGAKTTTMDNGAAWDTTISTEKVISSESLNRVVGVVRPLSTETTTVGETLTRLQTLTRALSTENTTVGESLARVKGIVRALANETTTIDESMTIRQTLTRSLPETVVVGETLTRLLTANRSLATETVTIGESLTRLLAATRALATETTVVGDSLARSRGVNRALGAETVTVGESLTRQLAATRALAAENTAIGETLNRMLAAIRALSDTTTLSESLSYVFSPGGEGPNKIRALSDTVVIGESIARMIAANRALTTEVTAISESLERQLAVNRALSDTTTVGESLTKLRTVVRSIATETVSIGESLARRFTGTRPIIETTIITDSLTKILTQTVIPTQLKNIVSWLRSKYSISTPPKDPSY